MTLEQRSQGPLPEWALRERDSDLKWIGENLHIFWPAASAAFAEQGRGAIVVDTTSRPTGEGNPFAYFPQPQIERREDEDITRMVREYDNDREVVVVLLKPSGRTSAYRIQVLPHLQGGQSEPGLAGPG